jgi:two-component system cell cycle sensor histidine kinase/response regulator CckA
MNAKRVLIVDDEEDIRVLLQRCFERAETTYEIAFATNGYEALDWLQQHSFDLVVTDYNMPGITGLDVVQLARQIAPEMPVLLMSGSYALELDQAVVRLEINGYLDKPFSLSQFLTAVKQIEHT